MRFVILLSILLSFSVQAKETKTIEVPNCWSKARELAKRGTNVKKFEFGNDTIGIINGITFDTETHAYTLTCKTRDQYMTIEKWTKQEMQAMRNQTKSDIAKLAKTVGIE